MILLATPIKNTPQKHHVEKRFFLTSPLEESKRHALPVKKKKKGTNYAIVSKVKKALKVHELVGIKRVIKHNDR